MKLVLYSTLGCHLCETAKALLLELGESGAPALVPFSVTEIDIVTDDALFERYGIRIPVLAIDARNAKGQSSKDECLKDEFLKDGCSNDQARELGWPFDIQQLYEFLIAE